MEPPIKPRYYKVFNCVYNFLFNLDNNEIPFSPFSFIKQNGWTLITYSEHAKKIGMPLNKCKPPMSGFLLHNNGEYKIYYDDTEKPRRITFTLTHEIAHILLNHPIDFDKSCYERGGFSDTEYIALEKECDVFAKNVLIPLHLIDSMSLTAIKSFSLFNITFDAAKKRFETMPFDIPRISIDKKKALIRKHCDFISTYTNFNKCNKCGFLLLKKENKYCPICGIEIKKTNKGECFSMIYDDVHSSKEDRLLECFVCKNEMINDNDFFCKICGTDIINFCSNKTDNDIQCGKHLDVNSRYCPRCGSTSTFFESGLLLSWDGKPYTEKKSTITTTNTDNEDTPF